MNEIGDYFSGRSIPSQESVLTRVATAQRAEGVDSRRYFSPYQQLNNYRSQLYDNSSRFPSAYQLDWFNTQFGTPNNTQEVVENPADEVVVNSVNSQALPQTVTGSTTLLGA